MEKQRFIAVSGFGQYIGANPLSFILDGEGRKSLVQLMVEENTPNIERFVKTENVNGETQVSFCTSLAFEFLNRFNPEFCQFVFRALGYDWITTSKN